MASTLRDGTFKASTICDGTIRALAINDENSRSQAHSNLLITQTKSVMRFGGLNDQQTLHTSCQNKIKMENKKDEQDHQSVKDRLSPVSSVNTNKECDEKIKEKFEGGEEE